MLHCRKFVSAKEIQTKPLVHSKSAAAVKTGQYRRAACISKSRGELPLLQGARPGLRNKLIDDDGRHHAEKCDHHGEDQQSRHWLVSGEDLRDKKRCHQISRHGGDDDRDHPQSYLSDHAQRHFAAFLNS
jgi:hypothetical protein